MWYEPSREYIAKHGHTCFVCRLKTRSWVAPMGIVSGRFPCCMRHTDDEVKNGWSVWLEELLSEQLPLPLE